jgi:hypothetical protein
MSTLQRKYYISGASVLGRVQFKRNVCLVLYIGMGTAKKKYCKFGSSILEWEQGKAGVIYLVPRFWDGHGPKLIIGILN